MRIAAEMAGGVEAVHDMGWLFDKAATLVALGATKPYAVLVPGCSLAKPQKRWPAENFACWPEHAAKIIYRLC